ncbi:MAG: hypothetical protein IJX10_07995 [Phascolarctobacterium sp.]|nr:hypothetical protein [Phascolarctobacterium sp.]
MNRQYGIDLEIGIGYISFVVASNNVEGTYVEDFGLRLFDSGETNDYKRLKNQDRRMFRNVRRVLRRKAHRKERVKNYLQKLELVDCNRLRAWQEKNGAQNIFAIRLKGLDEKLSAEELVACIIHICNRRGYQEFYDDYKYKDAGIVEAGLAEFERRFSLGNYRSVADMILNDEEFKTETDYPDYHNHKTGDRNILIKRSYQRKELLAILHKQQEFYPQLTNQNINFLCDRIVFAQRDFETGPGDENDKTRKFMGFLDSLGKCIYYKEEKRAFRSTIIADVFALVNWLGQFSFVDVVTGEKGLPIEVGKEILKFALQNAKVTEKEVQAILKRHGLEMVRNGKAEQKLADSLKTLRVLKAALLASGYDYEKLIAEDHFDLEHPSKLNGLCKLLTENITIKRREKLLKQDGWNEILRKHLSRKSFAGTVSVCERYMVDAIKAFINGEAYGDFKARCLRELHTGSGAKQKQILLPVMGKDVVEDFAYNVVLIKALNEMRKVLNAIIRIYGSPTYINVGIHENFGRSYKERQRLLRFKRAADNKPYEEWKKQDFKYGRYIASYMANYLESNLLFAGDEARHVHILKKSITSNLEDVFANLGEYLGLCKDFASPHVSYRQNKKFKGELVDHNPLPKAKRKDSSIIKEYSLGNETVLSANKYYCVELYKDREGRTALRGIRYVDLVKRNKKLYLVVDYPEGYKEHLMYLFQNDYIKIFDRKGNTKFEGYYRNVKAITRNLLNVRNSREINDVAIYVTQKDVFKKFNVDVLGKLGGEVKSSVPFKMLSEFEEK